MVSWTTKNVKGMSIACGCKFDGFKQVTSMAPQQPLLQGMIANENSREMRRNTKTRTRSRSSSVACVSVVGFPQLAFSPHALTDTRTKTQISVESSVSFFDRQVTTSSARGRLLQLVCRLPDARVRCSSRSFATWFEMVQVKSQWRHANRNTSLRRRDGLLHHGPWCWGSWFTWLRHKQIVGCTTSLLTFEQIR